MQDEQGLSPDDVRRQLGAILASQPFRSASRTSRFLRFITEEAIAERGSHIKEYVVGVEVFDKPESYDPKSDSAVRVEARRLRSKLGEYYEGEGLGAGIRIELPKGSYVPRFRRVAGESQHKPWIRSRTAAAGAVLLVAAAAMAAAVLAQWDAPGRSTIAVLPFDNFSSNPDNGYICDGLVEELTTGLAKRPGLRVIARHSAAAVRKRGRVSEIGRALRAGYVVEGSVRESNGRLRVTVQLIEAINESHLWSEVYERDAAGVFGVHGEIVRSLRAALDAQLPVKPAQAAAAAATNTAATDFYWRGRYARKQPGVDGLKQSVGLYERALALDPGHARTYAALAEAQGTMAFHNLAPAEGLIAKSRAAARRALELDPTLAEPRALLAWLSFFFDGNWAEAEHGFRQAIEINPNYAKAHTWFALGLISRARFREAIAESRMAQELDPLSYAANTDLGVVLYCARHYDEAISWARKTLAADPGFAAARVLLGMCHSAQGRYHQAMVEFDRALAGEQRYAYMLGRLGHAQALAGRRDAARGLIAELEKSAEGEPYHLQVAMVYAGLREPDRAMEHLEKARQFKEADVNFLMVEPVFDPLRGDERFRRLLERAGLTGK